MSTPSPTDAGQEDRAISWGPAALRLRNDRTRQYQAVQAPKRDGWIRSNRYFYGILRRLLGHIVEPGKRVLHIGCETGFLLDALRPGSGTGVDPSPEMLAIAQSNYPAYRYIEAFPEDFRPSGTYDYILLSNIGSIADVQKALLQLQPACERHTRLAIYNYNHL
jgi:SAM-dependent methyltransferase